MTTEPSPAVRGGQFLRNASGATAVEFAMVVLPFTVLVFAILEVCIAFAGQQVLFNVTDDIAREIRTGRLKTDDISETTLRERICERLEIVLIGECDAENLKIDLREFPTFAQAAAERIKFTGSSSADRDIDTTDFAVTPGSSGSKNMLRVFHKWPVITDFMAKLQSNLAGGKTLHFATVTWQNEPFEN